MSGWIKIHRDLLKHWCASDPNFLAVWVHLLSDANFQTKNSLMNGAIVEIKRGQLIFGLNAFSKKSGVSISKLRRVINVLEKEHMIDRLKTNKYSIISITKYNDYQDIDKPTTSKTQANDIQTATPKEGKEIKEVKRPLKGSHIKEDWNPSPELIKAIAEKEQTTTDWVNSQVYSFVNYWLGISGAKAVKASWDATFRKWCNKSYDQKPKVNGHANGQSSFWQHPLENYKLYGEWHVETCGEHKPTTNGKPNGPLNPKCAAPRELIKQILNVGDLL